VKLDFGAREVAVKLVYYGPALSGKTTNLQALHALMGPEARGRLMTLDTRDDRTLFFDLLPLTVRSKDGTGSLRVKLFTVPGQPVHTNTRKMVLQGADGVAFIADSRTSETQHNAAAFLDLRDNLREHGIEMPRMPLVIQFNKRDLPATRTHDELAELAKRGREPVYQAVATRGEGVVETLIGLLDLTWRTLEATHGLSRAIGVDGNELMESALRQLGDERPLEEVLAVRIGGDTSPRSTGSAGGPGAPRSTGGVDLTKERKS
jgi:signal recognition particle receptor subunit beta